MSAWIEKAARPLEALLGLTFLVSALSKVVIINTFVVQIWAYGVFDDKAWLPAAAFLTLTVETLLGGAMLFGLRFRMFSFAAVEVLLVVFTGLILYGWTYFDLEDCGCFGPLEMSPSVSIAKNAVLALLTGAAWWGMVRKTPPRPRFFAWKAAATVLLTLVLLATAYAKLEKVGRRDNPEEKNGPPGKFAQFEFATPQGYFNLAEGQYLVAMLSMSCDHCMEEIPDLNQLTFEPDMPPLVALCLEENEGDMVDFRLATNPQFPMHNLGDQVLLYFNLIGDDTFRLYYVEDGHAAAFWDGAVPPFDELRGAMAEGGETGVSKAG